MEVVELFRQIQDKRVPLALIGQRIGSDTAFKEHSTDAFPISATARSIQKSCAMYISHFRIVDQTKTKIAKKFGRRLSHMVSESNR